MLPKKHRLPVKEFEKVMKAGQGYHGRFFYLKILSNNKKGIRVGVAVARDLTKKAVERNYYKRVLRSIIKETLPYFNIDSDVVFIIQKTAKGVSYKELKKEMEQISKKI